MSKNVHPLSSKVRRSTLTISHKMTRFLDNSSSHTMVKKLGPLKMSFTNLFLKVAQWENGFIKRPHNTANLNFPSPKLRGFCFDFCKGINSIPHCKILAQLSPSYWTGSLNSSLKGKQRVKGKEISNLL